MINNLAFYSTLLDNLPLGVVVFDREGNFIYVNSKMVSWRGMTVEQYLKTNIHDLSDKRMISDSAFDLVMEKKKPVRRIQYYRNLEKAAGAREGIRIVTGVPIFDGSGRIENVISFLQDVGEFNEIYHELESHGELIMPDMEHQKKDFPRAQIIAESPAMRQLLEMAAMIAKTDSSVLLFGESGTGKEVLAHYIWECCERKDKPFIEVNCASFTESLLESELFGYEKGTFTGALKTGKPGLVEAADGGTLFLDEINSLPLGLQGKFLKLIDEKRNRRIGSEQSKKVDFRLIAATNCNLLELVQKGTFRSDLYYRLNVVPLRIPPLRDRREDIIPLLKTFIRSFSEQYGMKKRFSDDTLNYLREYDWPGNVRELRNFVERMVIMTPHDIDIIKGIPDTLMYQQESSPAEHGERCQTGSIMTKEKIVAALKLCNGNREMTAKYLGISRRTLQYRIQEYDLPNKRNRG